MSNYVKRKKKHYNVQQYLHVTCHDVYMKILRTSGFFLKINHLQIIYFSFWFATCSGQKQYIMFTHPGFVSYEYNKRKSLENQCNVMKSVELVTRTEFES